MSTLQATVMRPITITVDTATAAFVGMCRDILCQCMETSAIAYWAESRNPILDEGRAGEYDSVEFRPDDNEGRAFHAGDPRNDWQKIGRNEIAAGMLLIVMGEVGVRADLRTMVTTAFLDAENADIDAEGADTIMQVTMFKELVFG